MITRAEPRYKQAFIKMITTFRVQNPDPDHDPAFIAIIGGCTPPPTVEAIEIFIKDLNAAKILPLNLTSSDSGYHLVF